MEANVEAAKKAVGLAETDLRTSLAKNDFPYPGLDYQLAKYRDACVNFVFVDWNAAASRDVETWLWNNHAEINSKKFRPYLAKFRQGDGKKKHVERRKAEKLFLDFIKSSMRFYRGFIQRLASHFKDVPEVFEIARKFSLDTLSADAPVSVGMDLKVKILQSCHATLIHLGDLSRYREMELNQKQRNWGPAKGYYDLATALDPADGQSFNQLAVISREDKDLLRVVYYLYRALCIGKPHPQAPANLESAFRKLLRHYQRGEPIVPTEQLPGISNALVSAFLVYHAACHADPSLSDNEVQQEALLAQFATEVKTKPFDSTLRKMCLINIAASQQVTEQVEGCGTIEESKAHKLQATLVKTQALNVGTFLVLLELLSEELRVIKQGNAELSPCIRRLLPLLRLYNGWLLSNIRYLLEYHSGREVILQTSKFWSTYAKALTVVVAAFNIRDLPQLHYLLDEDQDTIAFTPFSALVRKLHFEDGTGSSKPSRDDASLNEALSPEEEMRYRIKAFVVTGVYLCKHKHDFSQIPVPLEFGEGHFLCTIDEPSGLLSKQHASHHVLGAMTNGTNHADSLPTLANTAETLARSENDPRRTFSPHQQKPNAIATPEQSGKRPSSSTFTAQDLVRQLQQPSPTPLHNGDSHASHRTSLPSIFQTPFTPLPGEIPNSESRPGTAHQTLPPSTAPVPPLRGNIEFQQQLAQMQHNIQARTSPIASLDPTPSSYYETPTGLNTFMRHQPDSSPTWERSMTTPSSAHTEVPRRPLPRASPFGAVGETRPKSAKTPTSGQPG